MKILGENRRGLSEAFYGVLAGIALAASFLLRFDFTLDPAATRLLETALAILLPAKLAVFRAFSLRDLAWRYVGFWDLKRIAAANLAASSASTLALWITLGRVPPSIYVLDSLVCLSLTVLAKAAVPAAFEKTAFEGTRGREVSEGTRGRGAGGRKEALRRVLIYGAGRTGATLAGEIHANPGLGYRVIGLVDDAPHKRDLRIHGVRVLGNGDRLPGIVRERGIDEVLLALPRATAAEIRAAFEKCHGARVAARRIPALEELIGRGMISWGMIGQAMTTGGIGETWLTGGAKDQAWEDGACMEDLLGRAAVRLDEHPMRRRFRGRVVLVTGAGGSIGSELCRQIARFRPAAVIGFDQAETPLFQIERELGERFPGVAFYAEVGSIRNRRRLEDVFRAYRPASVYHAAAYKHVPLMEAHVFEAVENNVFGTRQVARAAARHGVEDFVLVSSDKAVRPANVMGATKRLAELVCLGGEADDAFAGTKFMAVRFGNVLGSNGSVVPLFQRQISAGGPVTVTHPDMQRFFMTVSEAAQLVLQAAAMGRGGEIFVLDMGDPVRIVDLARNLIRSNGLRPEDIEIRFSGIRPGEKLCEELNAAGETTAATRHAHVRTCTGRSVDRDTLARVLEALRRHVEARDAAGVVLALKEMIPEYTPSSVVAAGGKARSVVA